MTTLTDRIEYKGCTIEIHNEGNMYWSYVDGVRKYAMFTRKLIIDQTKAYIDTFALGNK